jgi:antitoxin ParD1/3/4
MTMTVELGALEAVVERLVKEGRYGSKSEVLRTGVRLVEEREAKLAELQALLQVGLDDIAAGRVHDAEEVFREIEEGRSKRDAA